jgi:hypothetical protein
VYDFRNAQVTHLQRSIDDRIGDVDSRTFEKSNRSAGMVGVLKKKILVPTYCVRNRVAKTTGLATNTQSPSLPREEMLRKLVAFSI